MDQAFAKFVLVVIKALEDGWQPGEDIPVIVLEAFKDFWPELVALIEGLIKKKP